jgi:hypothetical protein
VNQRLGEELALLGGAGLIQNDDRWLDAIVQEAQDTIQGLASSVVEKHADVEAGNQSRFLIRHSSHTDCGSPAEAASELSSATLGFAIS